jgi:hypothetical protein
VDDAGTMYTIIGADGKEYGPVPADKVREWLATNRANKQTRIKHNDTGIWTTVGELPEFGAQTATAAEPPSASAPAAQNAPASAPLTGSIAEITAALRARGGAVDVFGCLGRSFELWKANLLPLVGVTVLMCIMQFAAGLIPVLGILSGLVLNGVFYGGLYYYYLGKMRGEHREVGDIFAGFKNAFVPLMLANLLIFFLTLAVTAPFFGPFLFEIGKAIIAGGGEPPDLSGASVGMIFLGFIPVVYLGISWIMTFPLIIDKGLGPWTAMEVSRRLVTRRWFHVFFVVLFGAILVCLGLLALIIGIFFAMPLLFGAVLYAYEDLTGGKS